jgi:NADH-quinone oxidoreductase subunit A
MLTEFGIILLFIIVGFIFVAMGLIVAALIRPSRPDPVKNSTYECGEIPIGEPWIKFNTRFYVIALAFIIFDVELVMLFPWAVVFKSLGWFAFWAMVIFVSILMLGLVYDWARGYLEWERPEPYIPKLSDLIVTKKD